MARDGFWAETDTVTLYELLESKDVFESTRGDVEFERSIRDELERRGMPQEPFRLRAVS